MKLLPWILAGAAVIAAAFGPGWIDASCAGYADTWCCVTGCCSG